MKTRTPPPVAEIFVRVLVEFGVVGGRYLFGGCRPWSRGRCLGGGGGWWMCVCVESIECFMADLIVSRRQFATEESILSHFESVPLRLYVQRYIKSYLVLL